MNNITFGDDEFGYYETVAGGAGAVGSADFVTVVLLLSVVTHFSVF